VGIDHRLTRLANEREQRQRYCVLVQINPADPAAAQDPDRSPLLFRIFLTKDLVDR
jgi:hypothetical protein